MAETPIAAEAGEDIPLPDAVPSPESGAPPEADTPAPPAQTAGGPVLLHDRYLIDTTAPIPELDTPSAKAYKVEDRRELGRVLFGLVCTPGLPTRTDVMGELKDSELDGLLPLVEWDIVDWPLRLHSSVPDGSSVKTGCPGMFAVRTSP